VITATVVGGMVLLMILRVPVCISIGVPSALGVYLAGVPLEVVPRMMIEAVDSFILLAVPFFILAGQLLNAGGATDRIFEFARRLFGHIPGGLAQVNVGGSLIFAGMSGAALADLAGLGSVEIKAMRDRGYAVPFATAVTLASCVVGPIIPPSVSFIVYSLVTGVSTGRMFLAGIVPGLLIGLALMAYVWLRTRLSPSDFTGRERFDASQLARATRLGFPALLMPPIIVGAMITGIATPTEVGVIAAVYAFALGIAWDLTLTRLKECLIETATMTALIMFVIAVSGAMSWIITSERSIHVAAAALAEAVVDPLTALILINFFLLVLGMFIEPLPALLISAAILFPVTQAMGIDPVHFGVVLTFNLLIGIITPPMGIGLFVAARVAGISVEAVMRATLPFLLPLFVALAVITAVPALSTWLPNLVFGPLR